MRKAKAKHPTAKLRTPIARATRSLKMAEAALKSGKGVNVVAYYLRAVAYTVNGLTQFLKANEKQANARRG